MYDWLHYFCGEWEGWALVNRFNHTSGVTAITPTDRPKSVRNCCVIEVFGGVFYVVTMLFGIFCVCMGICHRTESDLFLFVLLSTLILSCSVERCNKVPRVRVFQVLLLPHSSSDLVVCQIPLHYGIFASLLPDHQIWLQTYSILSIYHPEFTHSS